MFVLCTKSLIKTILVSVVLAGGLLLFAVSAEAANVLTNPTSQTYEVGETFTVLVQVDPDGDRVRAIEGSLRFNQERLSVVSVSRANSAFATWSEEPTFSNQTGMVTFAARHPTPITAWSNVLSVTLQAESAGAAELAFASVSVTASESSQTNLLGTATDADFSLLARSTSAGETVRRPNVTSFDFLDSEVWYEEATGTFRWRLPEDVIAVAVEVATSTSVEPREVFDPPIEAFSITAADVREGIQYLAVQYQDADGWGPITYRPIKIDTLPPEPFTIATLEEESEKGYPILFFKTDDTGSGILNYTILAEQSEQVVLSPEDAARGYVPDTLSDGAQIVRVIASDRAGNTTESSVEVVVTAAARVTGAVENKPAWARITELHILLVVLVSMLIVLLAYSVRQQRLYRAREERIRQETAEIYSQTEKIFSALRDEMHDQILALTKRPRLSKNEQETVDMLHKALNVSETLIDKEIDDVKNLLK